MQRQEEGLIEPAGALIEGGAEARLEGQLEHGEAGEALGDGLSRAVLRAEVDHDDFGDLVEQSPQRERDVRGVVEGGDDGADGAARRGQLTPFGAFAEAPPRLGLHTEPVLALGRKRDHDGAAPAGATSATDGSDPA